MSRAKEAYHGLFNPVEPHSIKVNKSSKHPGVLICSVYNFYPKQINVTWLSDGKEITSGVTSTDEKSNGNWLYQIHSHLEYKPRDGEKITCMVEHASFKQPKLVDWDPIPDPWTYENTCMLAVGITGFLLGALLSVAGIIYYQYKQSRVHSQSSDGSRPAPSDRPEDPVVQESSTLLSLPEAS
ncbi:DLA class II histocompatibility antigen, DR-1 beta chain-like isoform X1 [Betta splendens]|uniref:DLA class II histocompatibility antigen, DR-1 beta chain-like isoform X1 n=1 Tax=Betta splendens TaxID=158456 RepID=A0A6P7KQJ6_BETSP|nr:DLA class II histocompatibility antigen, DR-1 beta chain-like isoform X1 [Betta splendens]